MCSKRKKWCSHAAASSIIINTLEMTEHWAVEEKKCSEVNQHLLNPLCTQ